MLNTNSSKEMLPSASAGSLASVKKAKITVPKVVLKRFGIGWSVIKLFGQGVTANGPCALLQGTPRILLRGSVAIDKLPKAGPKFHYELAFK